MKIKDILFYVLISLLVWYATIPMLGGFVLVGSVTYKIMVLVLYAFTAFASPYIRKFFLLPKSLYMKILVQSVLFLAFFLFTLNVTGGIELVSLQPKVLELISSVLPRANVGIFGTIAIVSLSLGTTLQTIILLSKEK